MYNKCFFINAVASNISKQYNTSILMYQHGLRSYRGDFRIDTNPRRKWVKLAEYRSAQTRYNTLLAKLKYMKMPTIYERI